MVMRVSDNMKFNTIVNNLFRVQDSYNKAMEKMASQKKINRPSDDPIGMSRVLDLRKSKASVAQYRRNIDSCKPWIETTESNLSSVDKLLVKAREIATAQSTATASPETRSISAGSVQQIIDEMLSLANSKYGDRYLFSGTKMDKAPFSSSASAARIEPAVAAGENTNSGVTSSGTYTGSVNKTYVVKITASGAIDGATAKYQASSDGGKTWSAISPVPASGAITMGDGVTMTLTDGDAYLNDIFYVHALASGYYNGNSEKFSVEIGKDVSFDYSIPGESVFTDSGGGGVDIFKVLNDLKNSLEANDQGGVAAQLDKLKDASGQVNRYIARCGTGMNRLEIAENNMADLDFNLTKMISNTEDVDISKIATKLAMEEIVLKASYAVASKIGNLTILDFIR